MAGNSYCEEHVVHAWFVLIEMGAYFANNLAGRNLK